MDNICNSIFTAVKNGHEACLKMMLIERGSNINDVSESKYGNTPLHIAAHHGNDVCLKMLIDAGANLDITDISGGTPLHRAVLNGHDICVQMLVEAGATLDVIDDTEWVPLHYAAFNGNDAILRMLINTGADIDISNICDWTALHYAARNGHDVCIKTLIEAGGNINAVNNSGDTPLDIAACHDFTICVIVIVNKIVSERPLRPSELRVIPQTSAVLGDVLRTTMQLHGRSEAAKITAHLHVDARDTLRTTMLCLNRTMVPRDLIDSIVLQCV